MQAFPRVTHGEDLCKTRHELLMGRFYAKPICIICRESACILDTIISFFSSSKFS